MAVFRAPGGLIALLAPAMLAGVGESPAPAQDAEWRAPLTEPLVTDRPDFTESTDAVPRGRFQLEGGYTFTYDRERHDRTKAHTLPEFLLRAGGFDNFELRLGWEGYTWANDEFVTQTRAGRHVIGHEGSQGASDLYVGFKYKVCEQDGLRPHFGVIPAISIPGGSAAFSSGGVDPEIKLAWAYDLSDRIGVAGNVNFAAPTEDGGRFFQTGASATLAVALLENVGGYFEYYGFYPNGRDSDCAHTLNGGLTWQLTDNLQLDWRAGFGLNEEADDFFTGVGFAIRF